jgi:penicillin-binding protein 1C
LPRIFNRRMQKRKIVLIILAVLFLVWLFALPRQLFDTPYCTVMYDMDGRLLNAQVATDGHWRFPPGTVLPANYVAALLNFEDRYFRYHPGVNPVSVFRAIYNNLQPESLKSGASTLSMQVIRMSRQNKNRTMAEKLIEIWLATRLELRYSKNSILQLYAAHAPFGGNVAGLQAASWRYFGHTYEDLSWAEAATLAVLPNSPALIFPGRNQQLLQDKRNRLLNLLYKRGYFDELTLQLALSEPLPGKPFPLPRKAPHLFLRAMNDGLQGTSIDTGIDTQLQQLTESVMIRHHLQLRSNYINNMAVLVAKVNTGQVLAYWGNVSERDFRVVAGQVDVISSRRSPGSLLKPFLYAGMLQEGLILPNSLIPDVPTYFSGFRPENFTRSYDGAVPASRALARSLNIPAVRMLQEYHPDKFHLLLSACGLSTLDKPASHYGLSMILGGGEVTMWEIAGAYASMARTLNHFTNTGDVAQTFFPLKYIREEEQGKKTHLSPFGPGVIKQTLEAMVEAGRPDAETNWQYFSRNRPVAWKTGTSYGNRDAWSIGVNAEYVVAVWVGNATGEGRSSLTGVAAAAPVMFEIFGMLPSVNWFTQPHEDMKPAAICRHSGYPASIICNEIDTIWIPDIEFKNGICPYHKSIAVEKNTGLRANSSCTPISDLVMLPWFVLPPVQEYYFRQKNPFYKVLPPFKQGCNELSRASNPMQWIYPSEDAAVYIPMQIDGTPGEVILRVAHRQSDIRVHWHLGNEYFATTTHFHELAIRPSAGNHILIVTDDDGNILERKLEVKVRK